MNKIPLYLAAVFMLPPASAADTSPPKSIAEKLQACFDLPGVKESTNCLAKLREDDEINRRKVMEETGQAPRPIKQDDKTAEEARLDGAAQDMRRQIRENLEPSFFSAGSGVHANGDRTTRDMLYEAQVFHNLEWLQKSWRPADKEHRIDFWLDVPVRIGVRQLSSESFPVRTPTFNPGMRVFAAFNNGTGVRDGAWYGSVGLHHYSNGQEGEVPEGSNLANVVNGSFNTNYLELAAHRVNPEKDWIDWWRLSFRQHFFGTFDRQQEKQYPKWQMTLEARSIFDYNCKDPDPDPVARAQKEAECRRGTVLPGQIRWPRTDLRVAGTYGWGHPFVIRPDTTNSGTPVPAERTGFRDRLNTTIEFTHRPADWNTLGWYVRYDAGYDYYNINFQHRINRFQIGVVAR